MPRQKYIPLTAAILVTSLTLVGCGGESGEPAESTVGSTQSQILTGVFLDSAVAGIAYKTDSLSGITNDIGEFQYVGGESITFSIGGIDLPSTVAAEEITPLDIVGTDDISDTSVTNILQLLQTLDSDQNPDNGITVNSVAHSVQTTEPLDFSSPEFLQHPAVTEAVALSGNSNLVEADTAVEHFGQTLINRLDMPLDDPKIREADSKTYFLIKGTGSYQGDSLIIGKKHFTLNVGGRISAGRKDTSNSIWQLWNRKGRLHQFVYIAENYNGIMRTCWSVSPELAKDCGAQADRYYLFENESDAVGFDLAETFSAEAVAEEPVEELVSIQNKIDSAELAVSNVENATLSVQAAMEQQQLAELDANNALVEAELTAQHAAEQVAAEIVAAQALADAEERVRIAAEQEAAQLETERLAKEAQQKALDAQQEEAARLAAEEARLAAEAAAMAQAEKEAADLEAQQAAAAKEAAAIAASEAAALAETARLEAEAKKVAEEAAAKEAAEREAMELAAANAAAEAQAAAQAAAEKEAADLAAAQAAAEQAAVRLVQQQAEEAARLAAEEEASRVAAEAAAAEKRALEIAAAQAAAEEEARRIAAEQAESQRLAAEQAEADRLVAESAEADRLAAEKAEANRLAAEKAESDRLAAEQAEADRLAMVQALAGTSSNPSSVDCDAPSDEFKTAMLAVLNQTRASSQSCGAESMPPVQFLQWHDSLQQAAFVHSNDMAEFDFLSHTGTDGLQPLHRAIEAGFSGYSVGENIAYGPETVSEVHSGFMNSSGHCRNIMRNYFTHVGAACKVDIDTTLNNSIRVTRYWAVVFGLPTE